MIFRLPVKRRGGAGTPRRSDMKIPSLLSVPPVLALLFGFSAKAADDVNIAQGKPVIASHPVAGGQTAASVTDGDIVTFVHPAAARAGFYFQIDLGREYSLQAIELYSRIDCCPDRLSRVRMSVFADDGTGAPGEENWSYVIRSTGGSHVQGDVDLLTADLDPDGVFRGRFIRLTSVTAAANTPQVAEIQVFEAPAPDIVGFHPDRGNITKTGNPALPSQAVLSWKVEGFTSLRVEPDIGEVEGPVGGVTVSPDKTTTYTLVAANGAGTSTRSVTIGVDEVQRPPFLSEFLASNQGGLRDREENSPDWIEIGNPNPFTLNLEGYYLSDDARNPAKWRVPSYSVPPGGYAVIFADGRDLAPPLEEPHANFSLSASGEHLLLTAPDGQTVLSRLPASGEPYPPQPPNHSYGVVDGVEGFFYPPTPNAPNGPRFDGVVAPVEFSVKRGFYDAPQSVVLTCPTPGAVIRYTTNGAAPSATTGQVYEGPVPVTTTMVLRAAAFRDGYIPAAPEAHTYIFPAAVKAAPNMNRAVTQNATYGPRLEDGLKDVPSISLTTGPGVAIDGAEDRIAAMEWINPDGSPGVHVPAGVKLFGGAFTNFAKKSYRLSFRGEYGASKLEYPVFEEDGVGPFPVARSFDQLELRSGSHDMVDRGFYMSNIFTDATMRAMGSFAPRGRFVHLYLNGVYWGLYHLRERWGAAMMRSYYGGKKSDYESINGNLNVGGWAVKGRAYDGDGAAWERVKSLRGNYQALKPYVDVSQYVDFMILFMFGDSEDEYRASGPVEAGHGFKFWLNDADGYLRSSAGNRTARGTPGTQPGDGPGSLFSMLFAEGDPDYRALLADRIHKALTGDGALTPAKNIERLTAQCAAIERAIIAECARWNYRTPANWHSARDAILNSWFRTRTNAVLGQFRTAGFYPSTAAPAATRSEDGSAVTLTTGTGGAVIYHTLDGTDPRVSGTPPAPLALAGTGDAEAGAPPSAGMKYHVPANAADGYGQGEIPNLVAHWPFDVSIDEAGGNFQSTPAGGASVEGPGRFGAGALTLNGGQAVTLGDPPGLRIDGGGVTLSAWIKPNDPLSVRNIIHRGHESLTPVGELFLRINAGAYQAGVRTPEGGFFASGPTTGPGSARNDLGQWAHLAGVYDGAAWRLYHNGVEIASLPATRGPRPITTGGWAIGSRGDGAGRYFNGQIDEVRIYNRGLTPGEIAALYANDTRVAVPLWTRPEFDDSAWTAVAGAPGFAPEGSPLRPLIDADAGAAMRGRSPGLFLRIPFDLTEETRASLSALRLHLKADDGCVVYLNGSPLLFHNAPASPDGASAATAEAEDQAVARGEELDLSAGLSLLRAGRNVLALHGLNRSADDGDFLLSARLNAASGPPRLNPSARLYTAPLPLTRNTVVLARAYVPETEQWSPLTEVFLQAGPHAIPPGALAVSELHYHPAGTEGAGEFLELMNVSDAAVNLRGARFTQGIAFTFPEERDVVLGPGQRLVLTDGVFTFQKIHGWSAPFGGVFSGSLADEGERITLAAADGTTLVSFLYGVTAPWPAEAAGGGHSLVLVNPRPGIDHSDPANWRASRLPGGTPNATDALAFFGNPEADADGDGLTAFMEYALGLSDAKADAAAGPEARFNPAGAFLEVSLDHAAAADAARLRVETSADLSRWGEPSAPPLEFHRRETLPDGRHRSVWRLFNAPERLFLRLRAGD